MKKVAILGAGITGLSLAWFLQKRYGKTLDITLIEADKQTGGGLQTVRQEDALFECGPRSLRLVGRNSPLATLIQELGIQDAVITPSNTAKQRYVVHTGRLEKVPKSLFFAKQLFFGLARDLFAPRGKAFDETVASFFTRRFGASFVATLVDPLMRGIYATTPDKLSIRACFATLTDLETAHRSIAYGFVKKPSSPPPQMISFKEGVGFLPQILTKRLEASIHCGQPVCHIREGEGKVYVTTAQHTLDHTLEYDFVFSTLPSHKLYPLLPENDPLRPLLASLKRTSLATVSIGSKHPYALPPGFGFLCPSSEEKELLGVVFDSNVFPEHNGSYKTRLSVMMGEVHELSEQAIKERALQYVQKYLGINMLNDFFIVKKLSDAIGCYGLEHSATLQAIEACSQNRRVALLGASLYGVSVSDSVASAFDKTLHAFTKMQI